MAKRKWFDLCVRTADLKETLPLAKELGWNGIGWLLPVEAAELKAGRIEAPDVFTGALVKEHTKEGMRKSVRGARKAVELVVVAGGNPEINRAACEMPEVDILLHPWGSAISVMGPKGQSGLRSDSGMDNVMARLAAKNGVAIGFGFNEMLRSNKRARVQLMANMLEAAGLVRKAKAPFVLTSEAREPSDIRAPGDIASFGRILGLPENGIKDALSDRIAAENRKRLSGKWVMPGVELK